MNTYSEDKGGNEEESKIDDKMTKHYSKLLDHNIIWLIRSVVSTIMWVNHYSSLSTIPSIVFVGMLGVIF